MRASEYNFIQVPVNVINKLYNLQHLYALNRFEWSHINFEKSTNEEKKNEEERKPMSA